MKEDNDAARRVATLFEKWDCEIKTDKRLNRTGLFPRFPFWNTEVYNPFSRFSEDVAMRRAASFSVLHASHLWEPTVFITMHRALNTADRTGGGIFALRRPRPYSRQCDPHCA